VVSRYSEQIILNGKKKMVLDHLVVQQMDKQNEEGDIDNMLLHGAAALYEAGEDGIAASDIRYTSQNVDELIDKVQKDADDEAAALASQQVGGDDRAEGEGVDEPKAKETMSFGFAKIWEADKNRLGEIEEKDQPEDEDEVFRQFLTNLEEEKRRKVLAGVDGNAKQQRRNAAALGRNYATKDGMLSDSTPKKDWRGKGKKGKKGMGQDSSSDVDFALLAASESDDESDISDDAQEDLGLSADGTYAINGITKKAHSVKRRKLMESMSAATTTTVTDAEAAALLASTVPGPPVNAIAGSSRSTGTASPTKAARSIPTLTADKITAAKAKRKQEKDLARAQRYKTAGDLLSRHTIITEHPDRPTTKAFPPSSAKSITAGQQVLQWLYHILRELGMKSQLDIWAIMALPEVPQQERQKYYANLGTQVDNVMVKRGGQRYFTAEKQLQVVVALFATKAPAVPDERPENPVLEIPRGDLHGSTSTGSANGQGQPGMTSTGRPRDRPSHMLKANAQYASIPPPAASSTASRKELGPVPSIRAPQAGPSQPRQATLSCPRCGEGHDLQSCRIMSSPAELLEYKRIISESNEDEKTKVCLYDYVTGNIVLTLE
jgi:chromodomain-helicase-DNA-binding protein 4